MKRKICLLIAAVLITGYMENVFAAENAANQEKVDSIVINGNKFISLRDISEKTGAQLEWSEEYKAAVLTLDNDTMLITADSDVINKNGDEIKINAAAKLINNKMFVPVEAAVKYFGADIKNEDVLKYNYESFSKNIEKDGKILLKLSAEYPVFQQDSDIINKINEQIYKDAVNEIDNFYAEVSEYLNYALMSEPFEASFKYEVKTANDEIISIKKTSFSYAGGAHPNTVVQGITINSQTGEPVKASYFIADPVKKAKELIEKDKMENEDAFFFDDSVDALSEEKLQFYIDNGEFIFVFSPYDIAPYAAGVIEYRVSPA